MGLENDVGYFEPGPRPSVLFFFYFPLLNDALLGRIWNEIVSMQLAQCWFPGLAIFMLRYKYMFFFQIKHTEAILSNSPRKLLWFEITKMLIAV